MAFVDTLLLHSKSPVSVVLLDKREQPGGHWNDAYDFATLHQPARNYGVESAKLEDLALSNDEKRATRAEILAYYRSVLESWKSKGHDVEFVGGSSFDFEAGAYTQEGGSAPVNVDVAKKVVDARYTANDIPLHVPPKFAYNADQLDVIPPNELPAHGSTTAGGAAEHHYVVLGAGKTGQDTMLYLRDVLGVPLERLLWVMPTAPWITCRDPPTTLKQNTCMEFLSVALEAHAEAGSPAGAAATSAFLQRGFEALAAKGNLYRIDPSSAPTKFMDATLNKREVDVLQACAPCMVRNRGRVASISDEGSLTFADGSSLPLPWAEEGNSGAAVATTTFVHCTAGAFNFGSSAAEAKRPIFGEDGRITIQELFQFPGFCFNGATIAWIEAQAGLSLAERNALCEMPPAGDASAPPAPLGPVAGEVGPLDAGHPLCVSLRNLRRWYAHEGMGEWLHSLRLFSLTMNGYSLAEGKALAEKNHAGLVAAGVEAKAE